MPQANSNLRTLSAALLIAGVLFWGASFVFVKKAVVFVDAYSFIFMRFLTASILLAAIFPARIRNIEMQTVVKGILVGSVLSISFVLQTVGIQYTSASNAAFITGLCVVFVPLFLVILDRRAPAFLQVVSVAMAFTGLALLTLKPGAGISRGDYWVLLCAVTFGLHLVLISRFIKNEDPIAFTCVQLATVSIGAMASGFIFNGEISMPPRIEVWQAIIFCAIFASAFMYTVQANFQRNLSETTTVMIFALEPLFAAIFAFLFIGEKLSVRGIAGGAIMVAAMLLSEFSDQRAAKRSRVPTNTLE